MKSFSFNLRYQCPDPEQGNHSDVPGMLLVEYTRTAENARQAVLGALTELRELFPQGYLASVGPDLISFSGVARLFELDQKNMRALMKKFGALIPAPIFIGEDAAWHTADILGVIVAQSWREIPEAELEMAQITRAINQAIREHASA